MNEHRGNLASQHQINSSAFFIFTLGGTANQMPGKMDGAPGLAALPANSESCIVPKHFSSHAAF